MKDILTGESEREEGEEEREQGSHVHLLGCLREWRTA